MSWIGLITIIVIVAAILIGLLIHARNRGKISSRSALVLSIVIVVAAFITYIYPSALTTTQERDVEAGQNADMPS